MPEQTLQISTPSYQKKEEKSEQRTALADKSAENVSDTLVHPRLVSVVGVASGESKAMKSPDTATKDKQKNKHSTFLYFRDFGHLNIVKYIVLARTSFLCQLNCQ